MLFYELLDNSSFERQCAVAVDVRPTSPVIQWYCDQCGRGANYPTGAFDVVVEGGSQFPDFLLCGAFPLLIVSERVVSALRSAGIASFVECPVRVASIQDSEARIESAPRYSRVEVTGHCMIDLLESGIVISDICSRCGEANREPATTRPLKLLDGSWDGSDLFRDCRYFPRVTFCTQRVVDVISTYQFTNFRFDRMQ